MRKSFVPVFAVLFAVMLAGVAMAADSGTNTMSLTVSAINELAISGGTVTLDVNSATAGSGPTAATDDTTATYDVTTNGTAQKIVGKINSTMPTGTTLTITLADAGGDSESAGPVALTGTEKDLVTGITTLSATGKAITYTLGATLAAGVVTTFAKTVTLTLVDGE